MTDQFPEDISLDPLSDEFLDYTRVQGVMAKYHDQVRARLPELFLKLADRVDRLETANKDLQQRVDELEHQVRRLKQQ